MLRECRLDDMELISERGQQRVRELAAARGLEWEHLTEDQRERLVDELLHKS